MAKKQVFVMLGQSNALGHGLPMAPEDRIEKPLNNVWGLHREPNQRYDPESLCWSGYTSCDMNLAEQQDENHPAFTQDGPDREDNPNQYINNMRDGATAGYRYFLFDGANKISVTTRGTATGSFVVKNERFGDVVARIPVQPSEDWATFSAPLSIECGKKPLYFTYEGEGAADFLSFTLARG